MKIKNVQKWTDKGPSQWSFRDEDKGLYWINFNHGYLSITAGKYSEGLSSAILGKMIYGDQILPDSCLSITWTDVKNIIEKIEV